MPCYVGYQTSPDDFLRLYGISEEEAVRRARELGLKPKYKFLEEYDYEWMVRYFKHFVKQANTKLVVQSTDKGLYIIGIPLDRDITVCPFNGSVALSRLIQAAQVAKDQFFEELNKIGEVDLSAVSLWGVEDPFPPQDHPEARLYEWNG